MTVICWNMISYFMPDFPRIPITRAGGGVTYLDISRFVPSRYFYIGIQFFIAGFAYWTSLEVLFSIWFFYLLVVGEVYTFNRMGYSVGTPGLWSSSHAANAWQAFGALAFMLFWGLWMSREHLKGVWANIRGRQAIDDSEELMSYRTAGIGFVVGLIFMVGWLYTAGMELHVIVPFLIGVAILYDASDVCIVHVGFGEYFCGEYGKLGFFVCIFYRCQEFGDGEYGALLVDYGGD